MEPSMRYILFADDDIDDQELLQEAFAIVDKDIQIVTVTSGKETLSFLDTKQDNELPCLIMLDYNIPDLTGASIIKQLSENDRYSKIPKIVWSTSNSPRYVTISKEAGADYYFEKPQLFADIIKLAEEIARLCKK